MTGVDYSERFAEFVDMFKGAIKHFSETGLDRYKLILELRDCTANAGSLLYTVIKNNLIKQPDKKYAWCRFIFTKSSTVRFKMFEIRQRIIGGTLDSIPYPFDQLVENLYCCHDGGAYGNTDLQDYKYRHLFIEAVSQWLPDRFPETLEKIGLPKWIVTTSTNKKIYFDTDFVSQDREKISEPKELSFAPKLAMSCQHACKLLSDHLQKTAKKKITSNKKKAGNIDSKAIPPDSDTLTHPIQHQIKIDPKSTRMAHRGLRALFEAEDYYLSGEMVQKLKISKAKLSEEAARSLYHAIIKQFPKCKHYLNFRKDNPSKDIEPAIWLTEKRKS